MPYHLNKGGHNSRERAMAIYLARDLSGLYGKELGNFFGVSGAAITMRYYNQFSRGLNKNKKLHKLVQKIKKETIEFLIFKM